MELCHFVSHAPVAHETHVTLTLHMGMKFADSKLELWA